MAKFTIDPIALVHIGDNCYVPIAALIGFSQINAAIQGLGHLRDLVFSKTTNMSAKYRVVLTNMHDTCLT